MTAVPGFAPHVATVVACTGFDLWEARHPDTDDTPCVCAECTALGAVGDALTRWEADPSQPLTLGAGDPAAGRPRVRALLDALAANALDALHALAGGPCGCPGCTQLRTLAAALTAGAARGPSLGPVAIGATVWVWQPGAGRPFRRSVTGLNRRWVTLAGGRRCDRVTGVLDVGADLQLAAGTVYRTADEAEAAAALEAWTTTTRARLAAAARDMDRHTLTAIAVALGWDGPPPTLVPS